MKRASPDGAEAPQSKPLRAKLEPISKEPDLSKPALDPDVLRRLSPDTAKAPLCLKVESNSQEPDLGKPAAVLDSDELRRLEALYTATTEATRRCQPCAVVKALEIGAVVSFRVDPLSMQALLDSCENLMNYSSDAIDQRLCGHSWAQLAALLASGHITADALRRKLEALQAAAGAYQAQRLALIEQGRTVCPNTNITRARPNASNGSKPVPVFLPSRIAYVDGPLSSGSGSWQLPYPSPATCKSFLQFAPLGDQCAYLWAPLLFLTWKQGQGQYTYVTVRTSEALVIKIVSQQLAFAVICLHPPSRRASDAPIEDTLIVKLRSLRTDAPRFELGQCWRADGTLLPDYRLSALTDAWQSPAFTFEGQLHPMFARLLN
jgi:hypothetical protein